MVSSPSKDPKLRGESEEMSDLDTSDIVYVGETHTLASFLVMAVYLGPLSV